MPMDVFSPIATTLPFHVELPAFIASLSLPRWNTHWVKDDPRQTVLAKVGVLQVDGTYTYFADVAPGNLERLELSFTVRVNLDVANQFMLTSCGIIGTRRGV